MSSARSRSAGSRTEMTLMRKKKSSRKRAGAHHLLEVAVGGGDEADVGLEFLGAADAAEAPLLQHAQQLHLHAEAGLPHLVEKQRAAVGGFEQPLLGVDGAGEGALHVPEELRLQDRLGERAAVDGHERLGLAARLLVNLARRPFLAGARLAGDEHAGVGAGHARHQADHVEDLPAAAGQDEPRALAALRRRHLRSRSAAWPRDSGPPAASGRRRRTAWSGSRPRPAASPRRRCRPRQTP